MTQQTLYKIPSVHKNDKSVYDGGKKDDNPPKLVPSLQKIKEIMYDGQ